MSSADPGAPTARSSGGASSAALPRSALGRRANLDAAGPSIALDPAAVVQGPGARHRLADAACVRPAANGGFYSERLLRPRTDPRPGIDLTWRQLAPGRLLDTTTGTGSAQSMSFDPLDTQLRDGHPFWMRIFASGVDWARVGGIDVQGPRLRAG